MWPAVRAYGPYPRNAAEEEHAQTRASPRQRESATATRAAVWATQGWAVLRLSCPQAQRSARDHIAIAARQTQGPPCEGCRRNRRQHLPANSGRRNARKRCAIQRCRDRSTETSFPHILYDFEIDARLPAAAQLATLAAYGWLDGPPSPLYLQRRMVQLARDRYERALARAQSLHPGFTVTFPKTFAEFTKAPCRDGEFYFLKPCGLGGHRAALDDTLDEMDLLEADLFEY